MIIGFILGSLLVLPLLGLLHLKHVENKRISIRNKLVDFYISNYVIYYQQNTELIDVILDFCNEKGYSPSKICKQFPKKFLRQQPTFEVLF